MDDVSLKQKRSFDEVRATNFSYPMSTRMAVARSGHFINFTRDLYPETLSGPPTHIQKICLAYLGLKDALRDPSLTCGKADDLIVAKTGTPIEAPKYALPEFVLYWGKCDHGTPAFSADKCYRTLALKQLGPDYCGKVDDVQIAGDMLKRGFSKYRVTVSLIRNSFLSGANLDLAKNIVKAAGRLPDVRKALSKGAER